MAPGDALVEQGNVQQKPPEFGLGGHLLAVHVHHVREQLEGVEADADGQGNLGHHAGETEPVVGLVEEEHGVLEERQQPQVNHTAQHQEGLALPRAPVSVDQLGDGPVRKGHEEKKNNVKGLAPGIKHQGEQNKHRVFGLNAPCKGVKKHLQGEEHTQKYQG